jgi:hypothetical protein
MHIDHVTTKLSTACYVIRCIKPLISNKTLLLIYRFPFHTVMNYGIIFWGNSCHSIQIIHMQKRVIKIIMGCGNRESCRIFFSKKPTILQFMSQYILSLHIFAVNNSNQFFINSGIHYINIRHCPNFHLPSANLDIY